MTENKKWQSYSSRVGKWHRSMEINQFNSVCGVYATKPFQILLELGKSIEVSPTKDN